ncbi:basic proline-rich protein-like [Sarcophilus harrisii]|uniref:basic proline-rich protein-like n=1 Tax=Sarcophilus harrisii TaxID=9305 RepID=UPI001301CA20|nr:basic proline-rich protein-like [Sarcophilus harrisii]
MAQSSEIWARSPQNGNPRRAASWKRPARKDVQSPQIGPDSKMATMPPTPTPCAPKQLLDEPIGPGSIPKPANALPEPPRGTPGRIMVRVLGTQVDFHSGSGKGAAVRVETPALAHTEQPLRKHSEAPWAPRIPSLALRGRPGDTAPSPIHLLRDHQPDRRIAGKESPPSGPLARGPGGRGSFPGPPPVISVFFTPSTYPHPSPGSSLLPGALALPALVGAAPEGEGSLILGVDGASNPLVCLDPPALMDLGPTSRKAQDAPRASPGRGAGQPPPFVAVEDPLTWGLRAKRRLPVLGAGARTGPKGPRQSEDCREKRTENDPALGMTRKGPPRPRTQVLGGLKGAQDARDTHAPTPPRAPPAGRPLGIRASCAVNGPTPRGTSVHTHKQGAHPRTAAHPQARRATQARVPPPHIPVRPGPTPTGPSRVPPPVPAGPELASGYRVLFPNPCPASGGSSPRVDDPGLSEPPSPLPPVAGPSGRQRCVRSALRHSSLRALGKAPGLVCLGVLLCEAGAGRPRRPGAGSWPPSLPGPSAGPLSYQGLPSRARGPAGAPRPWARQGRGSPRGPRGGGLGAMTDPGRGSQGNPSSLAPTVRMRLGFQRPRSLRPNCGEWGDPDAPFLEGVWGEGRSLDITFGTGGAGLAVPGDPVHP